MSQQYYYLKIIKEIDMKELINLYKYKLKRKRNVYSAYKEKYNNRTITPEEFIKYTIIATEIVMIDEFIARLQKHKGGQVDE